MATTYIKPYKTAKGLTAVQTMQKRFDYGLDPKKCAAVSAYLCDPKTAPLEFALIKSEYETITGRPADKGHLFFQVRQAFPPGEVSIEEAQRIGYETAMRWTKGKYQFFVCTHNDKGNLHNHIYYNATAENATWKFHNFLGSTFHVRRLSDRICLEHNLSIVHNPKQHSKSKFKHYGEWLGDSNPPTFQERLKAQIDISLAQKPQDMKEFLQSMEAAGFEVKHGRGGAISFRAPAHGQERFTRLRSSTLGAGYGPEDIQAIIEGRATLPEDRAKTQAPQATPHKINLIVDIQSKMKAGKGPAYERWAKIHNLKAMAAALQYLQENDLLEYEQLEQKAAGAADRFHALSDKIKAIEAVMDINAELKSALVDYAKTRPVFEGYKNAKYSNKYLVEHGADIQIHRAAQATFKRILAGAKLPKMDALKAEYKKLASEKSAAYKEYRAARNDMQEVVTAKANIDYLLTLTDVQHNKDMER